MGNPYPVEITDEQGESRLTGFADFTDPSNQPGGGSQPVQTSIVTLTSMQLLSIFTTPVQLIAAPGANKVIVPMRCAQVFNPVTTPYTDHGGDLILGIGTINAAFWEFDGIATAGFWDQATKQLNSDQGGGIGPSTGALSDWANQPVIAGQDTANPTGGDGTVTFTTYYVVLDV